jgi:LPXTG-site transpeptidase (sortase) family protein
MLSPNEENPNSQLCRIWINKSRSLLLVVSGAAFIAVSLIILVLIFGSLLRSEIGYLFSEKGSGMTVSENRSDGIMTESKKVIAPIDQEFGIVIPKISANSKVIANIDPTDSAIYQKALTKGVAHADGSALPNEEGNIFIFSHSGQDLIEANRYNAVFYLLGKLEAGDGIFIFYQGEKISYRVKEKKVVSASDIQYMAKESQNSTLTLMTCWPAGTTWKRLIVIAEKNN